MPVILAYDKDFMSLTLESFKALSPSDVERIFKPAAQAEALLLHRALISDSFSDLLRFYTLTNTPRAKLIAERGNEPTPSISIKILKRYALVRSNADYLKGRKLAKFWVTQYRERGLDFETAKIHFAKKFRRDLRTEAETLFNVLVGKAPASDILSFADEKYIEDSIDALIETNASERNLSLCVEAKRSLYDAQKFSLIFVDAELLRLSMLNRDYEELMHYIRRTDWLVSSDYMSQSTAVLLWRLWERFGKD